MAVLYMYVKSSDRSFIETDEMKPFQVNRTKDDDIQANGKGVNVSLIMKKLGIDSTALGFKSWFYW